MPKMRKQLEEKELREMVMSGQKKYVTYKEAMLLYSLGRHSIEELAKDAKARYYVKGRVLIDTIQVNDHIENNCEYDE